MSLYGALVLRPEPGNARTAARLAALGFSVLRCPLFTVHPVAWFSPELAGYDSLLLTSANAVRHAGPGLALLAGLPVLAVGSATAAAARAAGLDVALTGDGGVDALLWLARARGHARPLHLAGRDRTGATDALTVYASDPVPVAASTVRGWAGRAALLHSVRAARCFAGLADAHRLDRSEIGIAALSPAVAAAAGEGWAVCRAAERPDDAMLVALVGRLIDRPGLATDKGRR